MNLFLTILFNISKININLKILWTNPDYPKWFMVQLIKQEVNNHQCLISYHGMYKLKDKDNKNIKFIIIIKFRIVNR